MSSGNRHRPFLGGMAHFLKDRRGATATIFAIALPLLAGAGALAVNVGVWTVQKRQAQGAADAAAYSAAIADKAGADLAQATIEAKAVTANLGFVDGADGVTIVVNSPPTLGSQAGVAGYWEVFVRQPQSLGLARYFTSATPIATGRAVAGGASGGNGCIIALSPSAANAVHFENNAMLTNASCGIYSNSSSNSAIQCNNNCVIDAAMYTVGQVSWGNKKPNGTMETGQAPAADPYANTEVSLPACTFSTKQGAGSYSGGTRFCGGLDIPNNGTVNFAPGVYYIDTIFDLENGVTINGSGVTLIFNPTGDASFKIEMMNNATWNLIAPTSGPYQGIAIMQKSGAPSAFTFRNNHVFNIQGALYFPTQGVTFRNNFNSNVCTQVVALTVVLAENATMKAVCPGSGIRDVGGSTIALIE